MLNKETIVFGGGCFWCTEAIFKMLKGVISVDPGYAGGSTNNPTYSEVSSGKTGHAEVIKIEYDPSIISLNDLLTVFFSTHDPRLRQGYGGQATTPNRQGNDIGEQYRSIILYTNEEQKETSEKFTEEINKSSEKGYPIVTEVKELNKFYFAEQYHKDYYENNKNQNYCQVIINPKLAKVQEKFAKLLKATPIYK